MCARGLNTLTSKNAHCLSFPQNPYALMSTRAPSSVLAVLWCSLSFVIGCKVGSIPTLWQTCIAHKIGCDVSDFVVAHCRKFTIRTTVSECTFYLYRRQNASRKLTVLCEEQIHAQRLEGQYAMWRLQFPEHSRLY